MADSDYICVYRQFFEDFAQSSEKEDHRPIRLNIYNLSFDELKGETMQSCINFLTERYLFFWFYSLKYFIYITLFIYK